MLDVALPNLQSPSLLGFNPGSSPLPWAPALSNLAIDCLLGPGSLQFLPGYPALRRLRREHNPPLRHRAVNLPVDLLRVLGQHAPFANLNLTLPASRFLPRPSCLALALPALRFIIATSTDSRQDDHPLTIRLPQRARSLRHH